MKNSKNFFFILYFIYFFYSLFIQTYSSETFFYMGNSYMYQNHAIQFYIEGSNFEYTKSFLLFIIATIFSLLLFSLSYFFILQSSSKEKRIPYECGFSSFNDTRSKFSMHYYLVSILFIVFDLEITFLFPWTLVYDFYNISYTTLSFFFWSLIFFLIILTIGFLYEWSKGALEWD